MSHPAHCRRCGRRLTKQLPGKRRRASTDWANVTHAARGLCTACRTACEADGTLQDYPPTKNAINPAEFDQLTRDGASDMALSDHFGVSLNAVRQHRSRRRRAGTFYPDTEQEPPHVRS